MLRRDVEGEASEITHANQRLLLELPGFMERLLAILKPPQPHGGSTGPRLGAAASQAGSGAGRFFTFISY